MDNSKVGVLLGNNVIFMNQEMQPNGNGKNNYVYEGELSKEDNDLAWEVAQRYHQIAEKANGEFGPWMNENGSAIFNMVRTEPDFARLFASAIEPDLETFKKMIDEYHKKKLQ